MTKDRRQKELLRKCGFKIESECPSYRTWARGDLRIALIQNQCPSLRKLTDRIIAQTIYRMQKAIMEITKLPTINYDRK